MRNLEVILRSLCKTVLSSWKFLPLTAILTLLSFGFLVYRHDLAPLSLGDALGYLSLGVWSTPRFDPQYIFRVPFLWLSLYVYLFFSLVALLTPKPSSYAYIFLFSLRRRSDYWIVTYLAAITYIIIQFLTMLFVTLLCVLLIGGELSFQPTTEFASRFFGDFQSGLTGEALFIHAFALPLLASVTIAALEVCLMYFVGAQQSFLCVILLLVASVFFTSHLLIGNYLMLLRGELFTPTGLSAVLGVMVLSICLLLAYCVGHLKIKHWDYIQG